MIADCADWFVFHCTRSTERECLERGVFATKNNFRNRKKMQQINAFTQLYLFNVESKTLHGHFSKEGPIGVVDSKLFDGEFTLQVKVKRSSVAVASSAFVRFGPQKRQPSLKPYKDALMPSQVLTPSQVTHALSSGWEETKQELEQEPATQATQATQEEEDNTANLCEDLLMLNVDDASALTVSDAGLDFFELQAFLSRLGLSRFEKKFIAEEVNMDLLRTLNEDDLIKYLSLPFGPARLIVRAIRAESLSQAARSDCPLLKLM